MTQDKSVDTYIAQFEPTIQLRLGTIREIIAREVPDAIESMAYGMPAYSLYGKHFLYYGAWKKHISIHPIYGDGGSLREALAPYKKQKDSLHFVYAKDLPVDLIRKVVHMKSAEARQQQT